MQTPVGTDLENLLGDAERLLEHRQDLQVHQMEAEVGRVGVVDGGEVARDHRHARLVVEVDAVDEVDVPVSTLSTIWSDSPFGHFFYFLSFHFSKMVPL